MQAYLFVQKQPARVKMNKKNHPNRVAALILSAKYLDRSGEKPYCTFIICIRFHFVNKRFHFFWKPAQNILQPVYLHQLPKDICLARGAKPCYLIR